MNWFKKRKISFGKHYKKLCNSKGLSTGLVRQYGFRIECDLVDDNFEKEAIEYGFEAKKDGNNWDVLVIGHVEEKQTNCNSFAIGTKSYKEVL